MYEKPQNPRTDLKRWLPLAIVVAAMALAYGFGWHRLLTFKSIGLNYGVLKDFIGAHLGIALLAYALIYIIVVMLSLPGGLVMTLTGGLVFGWQLATPVTVIAATTGASIIFVIAKTTLGEPLAARAGPWLSKVSDGFKENALSYLLFLRLVPAFPFFVVNLAPALLGVPLRTYVIGTLLGIIPGTLAFSIAGSGLGSVIEAQNERYAECLARSPIPSEADCPYTIDVSAFMTPELIVGLALLGAIALIPVAVKKWSKRNAQT